MLTLLLDFNLSTDEWTLSKRTTIVVLVLAASFAGVCLFTIGYLVYRLNLRLWAGPLDAGRPASSSATAPAATATAAAAEYGLSSASYAGMAGQPPSYEWAVTQQLVAWEDELPCYDERMRKAGAQAAAADPMAGVSCVLHI